MRDRERMFDCYQGQLSVVVAFAGARKYELLARTVQALQLVPPATSWYWPVAHPTQDWIVWNPPVISLKPTK